MRKIDFGMFRMFCIFVMSNITQWRGDLPIRAGIFIPVTLHIRQFCTSCWSVNVLPVFYNFFFVVDIKEYIIRLIMYNISFYFFCQLF